LRTPGSLRRKGPRVTGPFLFLGLTVPALASGCYASDPELIPDSYLQSELGLTLRDRVHTIDLAGGESERAEPASTSVLPGEYVQFVPSDWLIHAVAFQVDSLQPSLWAFLQRMGQTASPPLLQQGSRFVLSFVDAPPGRYPYALVGNRRPGTGVIVVLDPGAG